MGRKEPMAFRADRGVHLDESGRIVMWENQAMSGPIKAEDVTQNTVKDLVDVMYRHKMFNAEFWAAILNNAIDAGLVSPPCWEVVGDDYKIAMVFKRKVSAERWMASDHGFRKAEVRHWKGQTE